MLLSGLDKKQKEKRILNLVYSDDEVANAEVTEEPDFIFRYNPLICFGVEVTEFYFSESEARMRNIPNYFTRIMDQGDYAHKKDKKALKVEDVTLIRKEDNHQETVKAIMREVPPMSQFIDGLLKAMRTKNEKAEHYRSGLNFIELIVYDVNHYLYHHPEKEIYARLFDDKVREFIRNTTFREIYLISSFEDETYLPLKGIYFYTEIRWLMEYISNARPDLLEMSESDFLKLAHEYFRILGVTNGVQMVETSEGPELYFFQYSLLMTEKGIILRDHRMVPFEATPLKVEIPEKYNIFGGDFLNDMDEFRQSSKLSLDFKIKTKHKRPLDSLA